MAQIGKFFRPGLQLVLLACFIAALINSFDQLLSQNTVTSIDYEKEPIVLPSVTFCPLKVDGGHGGFEFKKGQNKTLVQLVDQMPSLRTIFKQAFMIMSNHPFNQESPEPSGTPHREQQEKIDLLAASAKDSVLLLYEWTLGKCLTFDPPKRPLNYNSAELNFLINMNKYRIIATERHETGLFNPTYINNWEQLDFFEPGTLVATVLAREKNVNLDTRKRPCDSANSEARTDCINAFLQYKLGCSFPWLPAKNQGRICDKPEDLDNMVDAFAESYSQKMIRAAKDFGCLKENCEKNVWKTVLQNKMLIDVYASVKNGSDLQDLTKITYETQNTNPIKVVRQHLAYGFSQFVADFGGYLGLLLGASILSIYDSVIEAVKVAMVALKK